MAFLEGFKLGDFGDKFFFTGPRSRCGSFKKTVAKISQLETLFFCASLAIIERCLMIFRVAPQDFYRKCNEISRYLWLLAKGIIQFKVIKSLWRTVAARGKF